MVPIREFNTFNFKSKKYQKLNKSKRNLIYFNQRKQLYCKIYSQPFSEQKTQFLIDLFQNNSFKKRFCPALRTIIVEDNRMVGYITKKGRTLTVSELKRYFSNPMIQKRWKKAITKYNFFYNDFKANNLIILPSRQISLIDFEAIARLPTGDNVQFTCRNTQIKSKLFNLSWYYRFLEERGRRGRGAVPL